MESSNSTSKPPAKKVRKNRWAYRMRFIFFFNFVVFLNVAGAWLMDYKAGQKTLIESLQHHPFFVCFTGMWIFLLATGAHKHVLDTNEENCLKEAEKCQ